MWLALVGWKMQVWKLIKRPFIQYEGKKIANKAFFKER
jgi:hypothetical protein